MSRAVGAHTSARVQRVRYGRRSRPAMKPKGKWLMLSTSSNTGTYKVCPHRMHPMVANVQCACVCVCMCVCVYVCVCVCCVCVCVCVCVVCVCCVCVCVCVCACDIGMTEGACHHSCTFERDESTSRECVPNPCEECKLQICWGCTRHTNAHTRTSLASSRRCIVAHSRTR
jgi:hypothetical protein